MFFKVMLPVIYFSHIIIRVEVQKKSEKIIYKHKSHINHSQKQELL